MGSYGSVQILERRRVYGVEEIQERIRVSGSLCLEGCLVETGVLRLRCFVHHGLTCANCRLEGVSFALERVTSDAATEEAADWWTLNLYGTRDGEEVYFTKDHVVPKSRGGPDLLENMQTMCWPCNARKGSRLPSDAEEN